MSKTIGIFCIMLKRKTYFASCKILKDRSYETWLKDLLLMVEIRGQSLMFRRTVVPKHGKGSIHRMNMKEGMRIYLLEVSDIGSKTMLQR